MSETAQTTNDGAWRQGTLDDEEFERASMSIRPSWVLGIDAARRASLAPPIAAAPAESANVSGFSAAPESAQRALASAVVSAAPPAEMKDTPAPAPSVVVMPAEKPVEAKPAATTLPAPSKLAAKPAVNAPRLSDARDAKPSSNGKTYGIVAAVIALLAVMGYIAFGGGAPTPSGPEARVTQAETPAAPEPAVAAPEPAVAAPTPPAPEPAVAAPPASAPEPVLAVPVAPPEPVVAPVVATPVAPPAAAARVVRAARPAPVRPAPRPAAAPRPARPAAPARPARPARGGVGFVTDSPY